MSKTRNIHVRDFKGSSVPVGSAIGKVLINSKDSGRVVTAVRAAVKGQSQSIKLSPSTVKAVRFAKKCK
jgi:hypothetical protein